MKYELDNAEDIQRFKENNSKLKKLENIEKLKKSNVPIQNKFWPTNLEVGESVYKPVIPGFSRNEVITVVGPNDKYAITLEVEKDGLHVNRSYKNVGGKMLMVSESYNGIKDLNLN